jgi:ketosteroid isomerase-like protein
VSLSANKAALRAYAASGDGSVFFAPDAVINVVHPFNELRGPDGYRKGCLDVIEVSFEGLYRTDYMAFGGTYEDGDWVTSSGYYTGNFMRPFLGIKPTGAMANLRFGAFHRMENGRAVESYIYFDLPELMIAAGQWPITDHPGEKRGFTGYLPGPSTQDGLLWETGDPARGDATFKMVTAMLGGLATKEEAWRPYWDANMRWYGPAAFGSFLGIEDFASFQVPFESAFSEWIGGSVKGSQTKHFARFGDGDYVASGGWPSLNAVQAKTFLGQASKGERLFMRVSDWWRCEDDRIVENWVFVDIPHVLLQMGYDVFGEMGYEAT